VCPTIVVLTLAVLFAEVATHPMAQGALRGMGAVAAGLIAATGLKLIVALRSNAMGAPACTLLGAGTVLRLHRLAAGAAGLGAAGCGGRGLPVGLVAAAGGTAPGHRRHGDATTMTLHFTAGDWWSLFMHFLSLSLLAVGGAITTAPDMHRYLVGQQSWLSEDQFSSSIAIAQAAPGPNVLFVGLMGWNVGLNVGGYPTAAFGMAVAMMGMLLPSTVLTYSAAQWGHRNRDLLRRARVQARHGTNRHGLAGGNGLAAGHGRQVPARLRLTGTAGCSPRS
jgi:chromate transport protein ChrA